jgi:hypothetical protein
VLTLKILKSEDIFVRTILMLGLLSAVIPFWWAKDFQGWDTGAHYLMAKQYRDQIFPWLSGFSPYGFGGFPQGYLYPSFLSWLVGGISKVLPLTYVFKFIVGGSVLLLPFSISAYLKDLEFSSRARNLSLLFLFSILFLFELPISMGGTLISTFRGGLVSAVFSLNLYFLYLLSLRNAARSNRHLLFASLLMALLTMSHAFIALFAYISAGIYAFIYFRKSARQTLRFVSHALLSFLLSLGWLVPYFMNKKFGSGIGIPYTNIFRAFPSFSAVPWVLVTAALVIIFFAVKNGIPKEVKGIYFIFLISTAIGLFLAVFRKSPLLTSLGIPFHGYRLILFSFIFLSVLIGYYVDCLKFKKMDKIKIPIFVSFFVASVFLMSHKITRPEISNFDYSSLESLRDKRGLIDQTVWSKLTNQYDAPNSLIYRLQDDGYSILNGTFVESSRVSPFIYSFLREISPYVLFWGMESAPVTFNSADSHSGFLGVQWILTDRAYSNETLSQLKPRSRSEVVIKYSVGKAQNAETFYVYKLDQNLVEFLKEPPTFYLGNGSWDDYLNSQWYLGSKAVMLQPKINVNPAPFEMNPEDKDIVSVTVFPHSNSNQFKILIHSKSSRWIFLKFPYFPNWHAFADGGEVPIFRASANMMSLFGKGLIEFRFQRSLFEIYAQMISALFFLVTLLAAKTLSN